MNTMNPINEPRAEEVETLKGIIENISAINREMRSQLQIISDALIDGKHPDNGEAPDGPITMIDAIRQERDLAEENLKTLIRIRERLW